MRKLLYLLAAAALAALLPATADAKKPKPRYQRAQFNLTLSLTQDTRWSTLSDDEAAECRTKVIGSGQELLTFRTAKPQRLSLFATRNLGTYVVGNTGVSGTATVRRDGYENVTVEDPCPPVADGDGEGEPEPGPDCGTKTGPFGLHLHFTRKTVELESDGSFGDYDLFTNCPVYGTYYPDLLTMADADPGFSTIRSPLRMRDLLNRRISKFVVEGGGELHDNRTSTNTVTAVDWTLTLKRRGARKK